MRKKTFTIWLRVRFHKLSWLLYKIYLPTKFTCCTKFTYLQNLPAVQNLPTYKIYLLYKIYLRRNSKLLFAVLWLYNNVPIMNITQPHCLFMYTHTSPTLHTYVHALIHVRFLNHVLHIHNTIGLTYMYISITIVLGIPRRVCIFTFTSTLCCTNSWRFLHYLSPPSSGSAAVSGWVLGGERGGGQDGGRLRRGRLHTRRPGHSVHQGTALHRQRV